MDLVLKFKIQDVVETLQLLYSPEETVPLLIFGTAIRASEEIVVMGMDYVLVLRDQK